ncbi:MAG TPA: hypothetical protein VNQ57_08070, partial [Ureibacillus sp.]|nr:hypothetical protein [Ureibacillus sp.]
NEHFFPVTQSTVNEFQQESSRFNGPSMVGGAQSPYGGAPGMVGGAQSPYRGIPGMVGGAQSPYGGAPGMVGGVQSPYGGAQSPCCGAPYGQHMRHCNKGRRHW